MAVHDLDAFADEDLAQDGEGGEDGGEGGLAVHDPVREVVDLDAVGEVADAGAAGVIGCAIGVGDDDDFVATVDEFLRALIRVCRGMESYDGGYVQVEGGRLEMARLCKSTGK